MVNVSSDSKKSPSHKKMVWLLVALIAVSLLACGRMFPAMGVFFEGEQRKIAISAFDVSRVREVRFKDGDSHYVIRATGAQNELFGINLVVFNGKTPQVQFNVAEDKVELTDTDFKGRKFYPIDPLERGERIDPPSSDSNHLYVEFLWGLYALAEGEEVEGWLFFETPKGILFKDLKWEAGDSVVMTK